MRSICVIGSLNIDMVISIPRFHAPGESIIGHHFSVFTGGKGGNQAVALGRLGAEPIMTGLLGNDGNGAHYLDVLKREDVDTANIRTVGEATGVALIEVCDETGDNRIALAPGANMALTTEMLRSVWAHIAHCDFFLMQLEIPISTVIDASAWIRNAGGTLILDPAPARPLPDILLTMTDYLTPNETELSLLSGMPTDTPERVIEAAGSLITRGARCVIAKMGGRGAMLITSDDAIFCPAFPAKPVDTTAAGDAFNAGLAYALASGQTPYEAMRYANAVGALTVMGQGAQSAMPTREQVTVFMNR